MRKYIYSVFVVLGLVFSFNTAHASNLSNSDIQGIAEILHIMRVSESDIVDILNILNTPDIEIEPVQPNISPQPIYIPPVQGHCGFHCAQA